MIYIKLPERLKQSSPQDKRKYITSDEAWAFTEQPKTEMSGVKRRIPAHELFDLFTADIIRQKTTFIR
jgi:hypothetical protein